MYSNSLNDDSMAKIATIVAQCKMIPMYQKYEIRQWLFDAQGGVQAIGLWLNGNPVNLFLFYPGGRGEINSIAIYGDNLNGHLNAIRSSNMIFGLPVSSASMEQGVESYVDVYLQQY